MIGRKEKVIVIRFLQWQFGIAVCLSVAVGIWWSFAAATSTMLGGLLVIIPNIFFSIYFFAGSSVYASKKIVNALYIGEMLKILLIGALLVLMLHWCDVKFAPLLIGFCGTYATYFLLHILLGAASWSQLKHK